MGLKYNWTIAANGSTIQISDSGNGIYYSLPANRITVTKLGAGFIRINVIGENIIQDINYADVISPASIDVDDLITNVNSIVSTASSGVVGKYPPIGCSIDGLGSAIVSGQVGFSAILYTGTISSWTVIGDISGDVVFDIKRNGVSIIGAGNKPTITSDLNASDVPSGWTSTTVTEGDIIEYNIDFSVII